MKSKGIKGAALILSVLAAAVLAAAINTTARKPETTLISWFEMDMDGDHKEELLVITAMDPEQVLDSGEPWGDYVKLYSEYEIEKGKPVLKDEPVYEFDLSQIKPLKVQAGDIDGDGTAELAVCVYKTAEFHPVPAKRPFFYEIVDGRLEPVWLGSRLSMPFEDYILYDGDGEGEDEIISIEYLENGNKVIAVYDWKGFGFEVKCISDEIEGMVAFLSNTNFKENGIFIDVNGEKFQVELEQEEILLNKK